MIGERQEAVRENSRLGRAIGKNSESNYIFRKRGWDMSLESNLSSYAIAVGALQAEALG